MAYTHPALQRIGPANSDAPVLWTYPTDDANASVNTSGYFNAASSDLRVGDLIFVHHGSGTCYLYAVNSNADGVVDATNGLAVGTADTD